MQPLSGREDSSTSPDGSPGVCPEARAGLLSGLTYSWMSDLVAAGYRAPLTSRQLWRLDRGDRVETLSSSFTKYVCRPPLIIGHSSLVTHH